MKSLSFAVLSGVLVLGAATPAAAARPCTDGADCYCDSVRNPGHQNYDPRAVICEDFEAITLHEDTGPGSQKNAGGENVWGPWYDDTGWSGVRGWNSYWWKTYGPMVVGCAWDNGAPLSPVVGPSCPNPGNCGVGEFRPDDRWQANSFACADVLRNGEFTAENPGVQPPVVPGTLDGGGVLDGQQSFAHRIMKGNASGVGSDARFSALRTIGVTMGVAYPANSESSGIWNAPWKHNEWRTVGSEALDGPFLFHREKGVQTWDPFDQFMWYASGKTGADCQAAVSKATVRKGSVQCVSNLALVYRADPNDYNFQRDWPFGQWACVRGYFQDLGSPHMKIQVWFKDKLIVDIANLDGSFLMNRDGYRSMLWNSYANMNQWGSSTTATTYRYEDNVHVTAGPPVSCDQIGFSGIASAPLPDPGTTPGTPTTPTTPGGSDSGSGGNGTGTTGGSGTTTEAGVTLTTSAVMNGTTPTVTATISGAAGPYQFLFDCGADGHWDSVQETPQSSSQYTCGAGTTLVRSWAWDRTSGVVLETTVDPTTVPVAPLGAPGKPVLVTN